VFSFIYSFFIILSVFGGHNYSYAAEFINKTAGFKDRLLCDESLSADWPIISNGISYDVRLAEDPIDGLVPVLVRIPVNEDGTYKQSEDGTVGRSVNPLTLDDLTNSLLGSERMVKKVMNLLIDKAAKKGHSLAFLFIDINDLNKVNNFVNKQVDGDNYIRQVGEAVRGVCQSDIVAFGCAKGEPLRKHENIDWVIRDGGDELVLLIPNVTPDQLLMIMHRIQDRLLVDTKVKMIFDQQREYTVNELRKVLSKYDTAIASMVQHLIMKSHESFEDLEKELSVLDITHEEIIEHARAFDTANRLHPTVSMGAAFVGSNDNYESLKTKTSKQSYYVKSRYKQRIGLGTAKHGVIDQAELEGLNSLMPEILQPLPPNDGLN
jgi:GGDEF domain-containing protein